MPTRQTMQTSPTPYPSLSVAPERSRLAVDQLLRLMAADSTSGREEPAVAVMLELARELGVRAERLPAGPGRDNVLVGHDAPEVVLCTHLDTVPPFLPGRLVDGVVWGRGACDAKGVAIAMLHALDLVRAASPEARASCLFVVGEETDHLGAKAVVASGRFTPRHVLLGEPCGMTPAVGQKGLLKVRLTASGQSGHSAYPEVGISATHRLIRVLAAILETRWPSDPTLGETTVNVGLIGGGVAANVIAASAEATLLFRCAAPVDSVRAALGDLLAADGGDISFFELSRSEPIDFDHLGESPGPAVPFNTDASLMLELGARVSLLGPGDMRCAHSEREHLSVAELEDGIRRYAEALARLL